jgi:hypothetical protein
MTWSAGGLVQASDLNTMLGGNPTTTANTLNAVFATGGGQAGYGGTAVANVTAGGTITTTPWNGLFFNTGNAASHQGTSISSISNVSTSNLVTFYSAAQTNLNSIYSARGNAASQGSTSSNAVTTASTWTATATFTHTITFANGDAARYFFNAGGQIKMTASHANTTAGVNDALATLCTATGTVVMSGQNSGTRTIAATSYSGITKIGGSGSTEVLSTNSGYFGLSTANTTVFDQNSGTAPYTALMDLRYIAKTNGVQGSNSDNGSVVTIYTLMSETGANGTIGTGTTVTCTLTPPATTYIANSWGTITLAGSVVVA